MAQRSWLLLVALVAVTLFIGTRYTYQSNTDYLATKPTAASAVAKPSSTPEAQPPPKPFPNKIWQLWKDDTQDPTERTVGFPHQWRKVNPTWRYERITHDNANTYVRSTSNASIADLFTGLDDHILRADFLRYILMMQEGGAWADIDVWPHQPIDTWIPEKYRDSANLVVGIETDHHKEPVNPQVPYSIALAQYAILAKPGHPAIQRVVEQVAANIKQLFETKEKGDVIRFQDVMSTTGPFAFTKVLFEYFEEQTGKPHNGDEFDSLKEPVLIGDVLVLPKDSFGWLPHENTHEKGDPSILVEHLFIASWRGSHPD